jgi:hypothetical protein
MRAIHSVIYQLLEAANDNPAFRTPGAGHDLTLLLVGFVHGGSSPEAMCWRISNIEAECADPREPGRPFGVRAIGPGTNAQPILEVAGASQAVEPADLAELSKMLSRPDAPARAVEAKARTAILRAAASRRSNGLVGSQANTCVIRAEPDTDIDATYYSDYATRLAYGVNTVFAVGNAGPMTTTGSILVVGDCCLSRNLLAPFSRSSTGPRGTDLGFGRRSL